MGDYIFFDTETTGLLLPDGAPLNQQPSIIEFAAIRTDPDLVEIDRIEFLCDPGMPISQEITKITGLGNDDLKNKKPFKAYIKQLQNFFLGAEYLVAHNVSFDAGMLNNELLRNDATTKFPWPPIHICTVESTFHLNNRRMKLEEVHQHYYGKDSTNKHRAIGDVETLVLCAQAMRLEALI